MIRNKFSFDFRIGSFKIYKDQLRLIFRVGLPTCVQSGIVSVSFLFLTAVVNVIGGVTASAAVGAVGKFNSFVIMPGLAVSHSVAAICAHNIGAGRMDRAIRTCKIGILMAVAISYAFFGLVWIYPTEIIRLFGDDPEVVAQGAVYLLAASYDFLVVPFVFCLNGFYVAGGHTLFTLFTNIFSSIVVRVPITYYLGYVLGLGLFGAGLGVPIATTGTLLVILGFLASGRWKRNLVKNASAA
jgi:Na+-driven multidrug efflux pump